MRRQDAPHHRRPPLPDPRRGGRALNDPAPEDLHAWYADYLDACNRHDLEAVRRFLHPAVRRTGAPGGADAWLHDLGELLAAFPDHRWKRIAVVVEGDRLAAHLRTRGTHRGAFQGIRATGRRVGVAEFAFYRVQGGRIVEFTGSTGEPDLIGQLSR